MNWYENILEARSFSGVALKDKRLIEKLESIYGEYYLVENLLDLLAEFSHKASNSVADQTQWAAAIGHFQGFRSEMFPFWIAEWSAYHTVMTNRELQNPNGSDGEEEPDILLIETHEAFGLTKEDVSLTWPALAVVIVDRLVIAILSEDFKAAFLELANFTLLRTAVGKVESASEKSRRAGSLKEDFKHEFLKWYRKEESNYPSKIAAVRAAHELRLVNAEIRTMQKWISDYERACEYKGVDWYWSTGRYL